jgi:transcriptional regulator with XRE-family HTH domain
VHRTYGEILKQARLDTGESIRGFANILGISRPYLQQVESGARNPFGERRTLRAAKLLGVDPAILLSAAVEHAGWPEAARRVALTAASTPSATTLQQAGGTAQRADERTDTLDGYEDGQGPVGPVAWAD